MTRTAIVLALLTLVACGSSKAQEDTGMLFPGGVREPRAGARLSIIYDSCGCGEQDAPPTPPVVVVEEPAPPVPAPKPKPRPSAKPRPPIVDKASCEDACGRWETAPRCIVPEGGCPK